VLAPRPFGVRRPVVDSRRGSALRPRCGVRVRADGHARRRTVPRLTETRDRLAATMRDQLRREPLAHEVEAAVVSAFHESRDPARLDLAALADVPVVVGDEVV
jgi:hypothetical protein